MLLNQGPSLLRPQGLLALEIDWSHGPLCRRLLPSAQVERDLTGRTRYLFWSRP
jgi:methylase of polypeptide subunit release factors